MLTIFFDVHLVVFLLHAHPGSLHGLHLGSVRVRVFLHGRRLCCLLSLLLKYSNESFLVINLPAMKLIYLR